mgnify:FL=1|tara:strand:- start:979 stop:2004 length:1026 start_codon:yes stop_codon:yes gene_type:complete
MAGDTPQLRVEPLSILHLTRFLSLAGAGQLPRFQAVLLGDWLARIEQRFPDLLPSRSSRCLVALQEGKPLAAVVASPFNRRGSCWSLQLPEALDSSLQFSVRTIERTLLQQALQLGSPHVRSWLVRCPMVDSEAIGLMRELGFQPLRSLQAWSAPASLPSTQACPSLPEGLSWQPINRRTAQLLWPIEQGGSFSHLRQITDRHWLDLLDCHGPGCGVLMADNTVLAGCIQCPEGDRSGQFELLRDLAWDPRLERAMPFLLQRIHQEGRPTALLTALDDAALSGVLLEQGWQCEEEQLVLGRSMWKRQSAPRNPQIVRPFGQVFGRLRPGQTPLPTPSLGRR